MGLDEGAADIEPKSEGLETLVLAGLLSRWEDELVTTTLPRLRTMMPLAWRDQDALRIAPGNVLVRAYLGEVLDYLRRVERQMVHAADVAIDGESGIPEHGLLEQGVRGGLTLDGARACVRKLVRLNRIAIDPRSGLVRPVPEAWHHNDLHPEITPSE